MPELEGRGWHIALGERMLAIHDFTRYGKPRVAPLVSIQFHEFWCTTEYDMTSERSVQVTKKSLRPWSVNGTAFGKLSHAFAAFIQHYHALEPS